MELTCNPFFLLGASQRDDRRRLLDLAEEKSLLADEDGIRNAVTTLTNPRKRLAAEVAWLPGLSPTWIARALSILEAEPARLRNAMNLPTLARANLLADGLLRAIDSLNADVAAAWIVDLANEHDKLDAKSVMVLLNEERSVASFAAISDAQQVDAELQNRRQHYLRAMNDALDRMPPNSLVKVVTLAVDLATHGDVPAPILVDDLVDAYEVKANTFLEAESENIRRLISQVRITADSKVGPEVDRLVDKLSKVVRNWDSVAQPIQMSARSRGRDHEMSTRIAGEVRSLAVDMTNEHGLLDTSKKLTALQQEVFAELGNVVEISHEDNLALDNLVNQRAQFVEAVTYEADVGAVFKQKLRISPDGVEWKSIRYPLSEITRVRWGATAHSVNGIPTGTTFSIYVGSARGAANIELRKQQVFADFTGSLWRAVGVRILEEMLHALRAGERFRFGSAIVSDHGIELERPRFFSSNERVPCKWTDLVVGNGAGTFYIAKKDEKKVSVELSYQDIDNVHVLEAAMRLFWKNATERLSDLLTQDG